MTGRVSAIVPTRGGPFLDEALRSAFAQPELFEAVVVHDRRPGEAPLELRSFEKPLHVIESPAPGPAAARNAGLDAARAPVAAFLDDDDVWLDGHLARVLEALARGPAAVACDAYVLAGDGTGPAAVPSNAATLPRFASTLPNAAALREPSLLRVRTLLVANPVLTPTVALALDRPGGELRFDPALPVMEDYDLWLRLARRGALAFDPRPGAIVRRRPGSASRATRRMAECSLVVLERALAAADPADTLAPDERRARLAGVWHDLAWSCLAEGDAAGARRALVHAIPLRPARLKNYAYAALSIAPRPLRQAVFGRNA